ncbi:MAG: hypothetical protein ACOZNI_25430 [Myxococcota bacterium]
MTDALVSYFAAQSRLFDRADMADILADGMIRAAAVLGAHVEREGEALLIHREGRSHAVYIGDYGLCDESAFKEQAKGLISRVLGRQPHLPAWIVLYGVYLNGIERQWGDAFPGRVRQVARDNTWGMSDHVYVVEVAAR